MPDVNDFKKLLENSGINMNTLRVSCPARKLNLNIEDEYHIAGMMIITAKDIKDTMKDCDLDGVNNDTILVLQQQQAYICAMIIDGAIRIGMANNLIKLLTNPTDLVADLLVSISGSYGIVVYRNLKNNIKDAIEKNCLFSETKSDYKNRLYYIIDNIWFLPYGVIDSLVEEAVRGYKESKGELNEQ